jgi:hypothetical protein
MKKDLYCAIALFGMLSGAAQANLALSGDIATPNQIDQYIFHVNTGGTDNLYTQSDSPFNPLLTLWSTTSVAPTAADWHLVTSNDNRTTANFSETINSKDSKIANISLLAGVSYLATVTESANTALGSLLSNGFSLAATQNGDNPYTLTITGAAASGMTTSPVPLPAAVWLFGGALMGFLGMSKRKGNFSI